MNKTEIENWFTLKAREFSLNPQSLNNDFVNIVQEYNEKYKQNSIQSERKFNPVIFANIFTKVRTIGFSSKTIGNVDFSKYRELLIIELNYYSKSIALDFALILSDKSILSNSKEFYGAIYIMFSHFVEIYNNLHQYKEATIETNIRIAGTYLNEALGMCSDKELMETLKNIYSFLKFVYTEYNEQLKSCTT